MTVKKMARTKTIRVGLVISKKEWRWLKEVAEEEMVSRSEIIRRALWLYRKSMKGGESNE